MKKYVFIVSAALMLMGFSIALTAQDTSGKKSKTEKKQEKKDAALADWNSAKTLAESKNFIFAATELFTNDGSASLNSKLNFLSVSDEEAVLQFGFENVYISGNGVGGFTSNGRITKYEVEAENPDKPVQIIINFDPLAAQGRGIGNFFITIYSEGYAELNFSASGLRLKGSITTPEKADVYLGNSR